MVGRPQTRVTVAPTPSSPSQAPVDFDALIDLAISKPARYLGNELGVQPRAWDADWQVAGVRWNSSQKTREGSKMRFR